MGVFVPGLLLVLVCLQCAQCYPDRIRGRDVCNTLHVSHSSSSREVDASNIIVALMRTGRRVDCIRPLTKYNLTFQVIENKTTIKGILVIPNLPQNHTVRAFDNLLGPNLLQGVCKSGSISHSCKSSRGCDLDNNGKSVTIPYRMNISAITFRYTIVFGGGIYIENQAVHYPLCETPTTTSTPTPKPTTTTQSPTVDVTTPPPKVDCTPPVLLESHDTNLAGEPIKYCSNFDVKPKAIERSGTCENTIKYWSNETQTYTKNSINYTCHTESLVRKTLCQPVCSGDDGKQWCCKNKIYVMRPRNFTCTADPELNNEEVPEDKVTTHMTKHVLQTKQCVCFLCSDIICPDCDDKKKETL